MMMKLYCSHLSETAFANDLEKLEVAGLSFGVFAFSQIDEVFGVVISVGFRRRLPARRVLRRGVSGWRGPLGRSRRLG